MDNSQLTEKDREALAERKERNRKRGRPRKKEVAAKKKGQVGEGKRGRPPGTAAIIDEYKARMLASPKSPAVLDAIFSAALNDDHKNQAAAWKLLMDRMLPVAAFEKDVKGGGARNAIQINITGVGGVEIPDQPIEGEVVDAEILQD